MASSNSKNIQQDWHKVVDTLRNQFGVPKKKIPTGSITGRANGDEFTFRSSYKGRKSTTNS